MQIQPERIHPLLLVVAAPKEFRAAAGGLLPPGAVPEPAPWMPARIDDGLDLLLCGVGKSAAAGAAAVACERRPYAGIISTGICGALPSTDGTEPPRLGDTVLASPSHFADEGVRHPDGFTPLARLGFPAFPDGADSFAPDPALVLLLSPLAQRVGGIATVSSCSGTDAAASDIARRTGAIAEAMEGAAIASTVAWLRTLGDGTGLGAARPWFAEVRVVSNTTGDRGRQRWDLPLAFARLGILCAGIARAVR